MATKLPLHAINDEYNVFGSTPDADGIYTVVDYKRKDNSLYLRSTLSNKVDGKYTTVTVGQYDASGALLFTRTWTLTYDGNGQIQSKVVS